ncbi:MAG TPA: Na+/H+ antiporter subunit E [Gammaproteobacteria bacterium]|nr:Na+/H+ antiporter subunit E [Gammaproteobacteria bacterium]
MRRWLPFPLLSVSLLAVWLLLNQSVAVGEVLLGCVLALAGPRLMLAPPEPAGRRRRLRRAAAAVRLFFAVLTDIIRSNGAVAAIILGLPHRRQTAGFLDIPLDLRHRYGLATLACIITSTPGTLWVAYDPVRGILTLHILDLVDEKAWIDTIKGRYERRLLEIFE